MFKNTLFAYNACRQWSNRSFEPRIHKTNGMERMYGSMRINSHAGLTYSTKTTESNKNKEGKKFRRWKLLM